MIRITKSIINIPLIELNNYCIINNLEISIKDEEIVLLEIVNKEMVKNDQSI